MSAFLGSSHWTICKSAAGRLVITYRMRGNDFTSPSLPFELNMCLELTGDIAHQSTGVSVSCVSGDLYQLLFTDRLKCYERTELSRA
jgi:hypothetical protein